MSRAPGVTDDAVGTHRPREHRPTMRRLLVLTALAALALPVTGAQAASSQDFRTPTAGNNPTGITTGPDGGLRSADYYPTPG